MKIKILADASLPQLSICFPEPFALTCYQTPADIPSLIQGQNVLLCRSTLKVNSVLLQQSTLSFVATASSGIDHIDTQYLSQHKINLIDAKGCNANAVADYVLSCLASLISTHQLQGDTIGVIGVGCVGDVVAARTNALGFKTVLYDPPKAARDTTFQSAALADLYRCDLICIHANLHMDTAYPSHHLIDQTFLSNLKPGTIIINAARGGIVDEKALLHFSSTVVYCTDVYENEPHINPDIIDMATICTPHIAGHSIEAKNNAIQQISYQLHQAYGLTLPFTHTTKQTSLFANTSRWQSLTLSLYDPLHETRILKEKNHNLKDTFIAQRHAHQYRHDFAL